jgi:hypothetical protein
LSYLHYFHGCCLKSYPTENCFILNLKAYAMTTRTIFKTLVSTAAVTFAVTAAAGAFAQTPRSILTSDYDDATLSVPFKSVLTRAQVQAELDSARLSGEHAVLTSDYREPLATAVVSGKKRQDVVAELASVRGTANSNLTSY